MSDAVVMWPPVLFLPEIPEDCFLLNLLRQEIEGLVYHHNMISYNCHLMIIKEEYEYHMALWRWWCCGPWSDRKNLWSAPILICCSIGQLKSSESLHFYDLHFPVVPSVTTWLLILHVDPFMYTRKNTENRNFWFTLRFSIQQKNKVEILNVGALIL